MLGLILCGGQSTRMGTDKGLLKESLSGAGGTMIARTWAQAAADKLKELSIPVKISVNRNQFTEYAGIFPPSHIIPDNVSLKIKGPLCGVLSAHLQHPSEDILALACDMPFMETEFLKEVMEFDQQLPGSDAIIFTNDGEPEPLCGVYRAKGLPRVYQLYKTGQLLTHSLKYALEQLSTSYIPLTDQKKKYFINVNTHAELNGL